MSEDEKSDNGANEGRVPWVTPEGGVDDYYSNMTHANWTAFDIRVRFGHLVVAQSKVAEGEGEGEHRWVVNEDIAVTMTYGQAKYLRNLLHGIIKDYEAKNGVIDIAPKWPAPTAAVEPS